MIDREQERDQAARKRQAIKTARDMRQEREELTAQLLHMQSRLQVRVERALGSYRFLVRDTTPGGRIYNALILPTSWHYYECRLNITSEQERQVDMLIVARHNAVVPVVVLELENVMAWSPLAVPELARDASKRRNGEEANLLLSKYILNFEGAREELDKMTARTRQRYNKRRAQYLKRRPGRPWAG